MVDPINEPSAGSKQSIRERGKAERRVRVVETAREMLRAGGVDALSMRSLSVEAGVSLPTIYNLIGGRDEVLAAVLDDLGAVFDAEVATTSKTGLERCFQIADRLLDAFTDNATLARSIITEGLTPMLADAESSLFRRYGLATLTAVDEASRAGDLDDYAEPVLIGEQVVSLTAVRIFRWATSDDSPGDAGSRPADTSGDLLRAAVTHGIGLILAGSASPAGRERVVPQIRAAQRTLLEGGDR